MDEILGIYRRGHIEVAGPVAWPDGTQVTVHPCADDEDPPGTYYPSVQLPDGTVLPWSDSPEFRQALIEQMDRREPVELTAEEEAEWQAARQWIKKYTIACVRREMGLEP